MDDVGVTAGADDPAPMRELGKAEVRARRAANRHLVQPEIGTVGKVESRRHDDGCWKFESKRLQRDLLKVPGVELFVN